MGETPRAPRDRRTTAGAPDPNDAPLSGRDHACDANDGDDPDHPVRARGPGLGDPGVATGNFVALPSGAKWWLAFGMLLGRLELLTLLVLLSRAFWRP